MMWASQTKLNREGDSKERGTWKQKKLKRTKQGERKGTGKQHKELQEYDPFKTKWTPQSE
jgi:hypothetical protein